MKQKIFYDTNRSFYEYNRILIEIVNIGYNIISTQWVSEESGYTIVTVPPKTLPDADL